MLKFFKKDDLKSYRKKLLNIKKIDYSSLEENQLINKLKNENDDDDKLIASIVELINRTYSIKVYDEQILGALSIIDGKLIEMKTGEGKTIVAIIASAFLARKNRKITIFTANGYLVERDFLYSSKIFNKIGISIGKITEDMPSKVRKANYESDIVYTSVRVTVSDFINDKIERVIENRIFNNMDFVIVDEVDYVLIDESTIPISTSKKVTQKSDELRFIISNINQFEIKKHFTIDGKTNEVKIKSEGFSVLENLFIKHKKSKGIKCRKEDLYSAENTDYMNSLYTSINAIHTIKKDVDYVVKDDEVIIIGKPSGRLMEGRRWSGGLHLAVEIKEGVSTKQEAVTVAETNIYYFMSKFKTISGMSGTTMSEKIEFNSIYDLDVIKIEPVKELKRRDLKDVFSLTKKDSMNRIYKYIKDSKFIENKKPILIGTVNVSDSEIIYDFLLKKGIENISLINAKNHEEEAYIMSRAGEAGRITISTSMSGRGTDITLGANKEIMLDEYLKKSDNRSEAIASFNNDYKKLHNEVNSIKDGFGGLNIIGFQRNRIRRLDNQLIGRSGRQGDNGSSIFFISGEDELMAGFESIYSKIYSFNKDILAKQVIENQDEYATARLNSRKSIAKFANPLNKQNDIFYDTRDKIIRSDNLIKLVKSAFESLANREYIEISEKQLDPKYEIDFNFNPTEYRQKRIKSLLDDYNKKTSDLDFIGAEKKIALHMLDEMWIPHLQALENARLNAMNSTYKQNDPVMVYEKEAIRLGESFWEEFFYSYGLFISDINTKDFIEDIKDESDEDFDFVEFSTIKLNYRLNKLPT